MMTEKKSVNYDLTEGSILKSLTKLSIPIILANLLQTAYQLVDTFWVGRLGPGAVAAVTLSFPIVFVIVALGGGLTMAGTILIAQNKGKKDYAAMNHITTQTVFLIFLLSVILSIFGYFISDIMLRWMDVDETIFKDSSEYLKITFIGTIFTFTFMLFQSLMRGIGEVKIPMLIVLSTVILNLLLDPLFIFGYGFIPEMKVQGAALATVITQAISTIIGLYILLKGKYGLRLKLKNYTPDFKLYKTIFKLGLPSSVEMSMRGIGMLVMTYLVTKFGVQTIATYGIGTRIFGFIIVPTIGLSMATTTLVGQNIGAGKPERAEKTAIISAIAGFIGLSLIGILIFIFANSIATFFVPDEPETILNSAYFIKILSVGFGFLAVIQVLNGTFRGAGDTMITMIFSMISIWILRFPVAYYLSRYTDMKEIGIWYSFDFDIAIGFLLAIFWFKRGKWKHKKLTNDMKMVEKTNQETIIEEGIGS